MAFMMAPSAKPDHFKWGAVVLVVAVRSSTAADLARKTFNQATVQSSAQKLVSHGSGSIPRHPTCGRFGKTSIGDALPVTFPVAGFATVVVAVTRTTGVVKLSYRL